MEIPDRYLGDGVYASWDGYQITLDLRAQPAVTPVTKIALNPGTLGALDEFRAFIVREREKNLDATP